MKRKQVLLRLPPHLHAWLKDYADSQSTEARRVSVNSLIIEAIFMLRRDTQGL